MSAKAAKANRKAALIAEVLELEADLARRGERMEAFLYAHLSHLFDCEPGDFHRAIYDDLERMLWQLPIEGETRDAAAYAYPRGHGKTTTAITGLATWVLHEWRNMPHFGGKPPFILIVSDVQSNARDRVLDIRDELETNTSLHAKYGIKVPDRSRRVAGDADDQPAGTFKWTEILFETTDGARVMAVGSKQRIRGLLRAGLRPNLILVDDLENDELVSTKDQRAKLRSWITKALIPTGIEGELLTVVVGTILHADSLLSRLLAKTSFPGWLKRRYAAQVNDLGLPDPDGIHVLWPEKWPIVRLRARRRKIGTVAYVQEYLNQAVDDATALFRREWLEAAKQRGAGAGFLYGPAKVIPFQVACGTWSPAELERAAGATAVQLVVTAWDVALVADEKAARERDTDYTVGITLELLLDDRIRVRRIYRKRALTPLGVRTRVVGEQAILEASYVVVENNTATMAHEIELRAIPDLPLVGHTTDKRKHSVYEGVPGMALLFEHGLIDLCWRTEVEQRRIDTLVDELHGLGVEAHDDTVMALWMGVCMIRKWTRMRDERRKRLVGPRPVGYTHAFPVREELEEAEAA